MTWAIILAAGRGERMRPLTDHTPKALLEVGGRPLVVWQIERLVAAGFRDIVINLAHLGAMIERRLGDGAHLGARLHYSHEAQALETAGGIALALTLFDAPVFAVANADVWTDYDYAGLGARTGALADPARVLAHLVLVGNPDHHPTGDFALDHGQLGEHGERLTFAGIGLYHRALFADTAPGTRAALAPLLRRAIANGQATGERWNGRWYDVGTPERLRQLDLSLRA